jgi:hypothetical protein
MARVKKRATLALAFLVLATSSCVVVRARDLKDIGLPNVTCASLDGSAHCVCYQKCVSEPSDCHCADE